MAERSAVAAAVTKMVCAAPATEREIARAMGYPNPGALRAIIAGMAKLPFDRIEPLCRACGADPAPLTRRALEEYAPALARLVADHAGPLLDRDERAVLGVWRRAVPDGGFEIDAEARARLEKLFARLATAMREAA